jgi:hypothetical protein
MRSQFSSAKAACKPWLQDGVLQYAYHRIKLLLLLDLLLVTHNNYHLCHLYATPPSFCKDAIQYTKVKDLPKVPYEVDTVQPGPSLSSVFLFSMSQLGIL